MTDDWRDWEPSRPLPVEGGLVARSRRGAIGETWWSQRFIALLESFGVGSRLQRGRNYARRGQVAELDIESGVVIAKVQGSRYTPYRVRIRTKALSEQQWRRVEKVMASRALPLARLLAGEMPADIEEVFAACKLTLFPRTSAELQASCTCPDRENPCKHIAATYYILAETFDQDPFQIFAWRGRDQAELLDRLRALRASGTASATSKPRSRSKPKPTPHPNPNPNPKAQPGPEPVTAPSVSIADQLESFWRTGPQLDELRVSPLAGDVPDALLRQLGPAPADLAAHNLVEVLTPAYARLAQEAERWALE